MALDMVRMPPELSVGFASSLNFGTKVIRLEAARQERWAQLESPLITWSATKGLWQRHRIEEFIGFCRARRGGFHAFRFWDPIDFSTNPTSTTGAPGILDQVLGYGDGARVTYDLFRVYPSSPNDLPQRLATEDRFMPIHGEQDDRLARKLGLLAGHNFVARFAFDGVEQFGFSINWRTRDVTFAVAPAEDEVVTGGWYYDWPAVLSQDTDANLERIAESWEAQTVPAIVIESVPFERMLPETDDPGGYKLLALDIGSPLLQKLEAKVWRLEPVGPGRTVRVQSVATLNGGGPHFIMTVPTGLDSVAVLDELTGSTIVTIAAGQTAWLMCEIVTIDTKQWRYVLT